MSEERIKALEDKLANLESKFSEYIHNMLFLSGGQVAFQFAVQALMQSHPNPEKMQQSLREGLENMTANSLQTSESEHLIAGQDEAKAILIAFAQHVVARTKEAKG